MLFLHVLLLILSSLRADFHVIRGEHRREFCTILILETYQRSSKDRGNWFDPSCDVGSVASLLYFVSPSGAAAVRNKNGLTLSLFTSRLKNSSLNPMGKSQLLDEVTMQMKGAKAGLRKSFDCFVREGLFFEQSCCGILKQNHDETSDQRIRATELPKYTIFIFLEP